MTKAPKTSWIALMMCLSALSVPTSVSASNHFETSIAKANPEYDLTDLFVFQAADRRRTVFVLAVNPKTGKDGNAAFGEGGLYSIHVAADETLSAGITMTLRSSSGKLTVEMLNSASLNPGAKGMRLGGASIGKTSILSKGVRIWAGAARDPFVGNSAGLTAFRKALANGQFDANSFDAGEDFFAGLNSSVIVVEVPNKLLPSKMFVYAASFMPSENQWVQVNRLAHPLMTHLFFLADETVSLDHVRGQPNSDESRAPKLYENVLRSTTLSMSRTDPNQYAAMVARRLLPDLLSYEAGTLAYYGADRINGRHIKDDAMDAVLTIFAGKTLVDHAGSFDRHPSAFPYVVPVNGR